MNLKSPIEEAKVQKNTAKFTKIIMVVVTLLAIVIVMRFKDIKKCNPRYSSFQIIDGFLSEPWHFYIDPMALFGVLIIFIVVYMLLQLSKTTDSLSKHDDLDTVLGDAHFMTEPEHQKYLIEKCEPFGVANMDDFSNIILAKDMGLSTDGFKVRLNANVLAIGGSGAGKSRFFAAPNILQARNNIVVTDPSGELKVAYAKYLENQGYEILTFDITDIYASNRYNPFHYIKEESDILVMVNTLIKTTTSEQAKEEGFWVKGEAMLLEAICLYIWHTYEPQEQTFENVLKLLSLAEIDENDATAKSQLDILFGKLATEDPDNLATKQYNKFKSGAGKTMKSFLISLNTRLEKFELPNMKYLTGDDDFHFEDFANSKKAIFVITPTADDTFQFIVSFFYSQFFMTVYNYAEKEARFAHLIKNGNELLKVFPAKDKKESNVAKKRAEQFLEDCKAGMKVVYNKNKAYYEVRLKKTNELLGWRGDKNDAVAFAKSFKQATLSQCGSYCPFYVQLILDEFANVSQIPNFQKIVATIRKYRICVFIILQALSQLEKIYADEAQSIVANCNVKLLLGTDDDKTNKWISESLLGNKTVIVMNRSKNAKGEWSESFNRTKQPLLEPTQISAMMSDYCIVAVKGFPPFYGHKYNVENHPHYKYAMQFHDQFSVEISQKTLEYKRAHSGPLRLRNSSAIEKLNGNSSKGIAEDSSVQAKPLKDKEADSKDKKALNNKLKKEADKENADLKIKLDERKKLKKKCNEIVSNDVEMSTPGAFEPPMSDDYYMNIELQNSFGIPTDATIEEINESVASQIVLEELESSKISFALTQQRMN